MPTGSGTMLLRRAGKLFNHIQEVLHVTKLERSPVTQEYVTVLRSYLLATPAYCEYAKLQDTQGKICPEMQVVGQHICIVCISTLCSPAKRRWIHPKRQCMTTCRPAG